MKNSKMEEILCQIGRVNRMNTKNNTLTTVLWSIAFPGFGQILNGKILKGIMFITLELVINNQANFNEVIIYSFQWQIEKAIYYTNYQWLMFYPCIYMFAIWDAFRDAGGGKEPYSALPLVFSVYFTTVGLIYSSSITIRGVLLGPVWMLIIFCFIGLLGGWILKYVLTKALHTRK